jgi:hypothetical protein
MFLSSSHRAIPALCLAILSLTVSALAHDTTHFGFGSPAAQQELGLFFAIPS